jgi:hypothetical protein
MAFKNMTRVAFDNINPNTGAVYHENISLGNAEVSDDIIFPVREIYAISVITTGSIKVEFTNDPPSEIETGSPTWVIWDGVSGINLGLTGVRVTSVSGDVTAKITLKTANA